MAGIAGFGCVDVLFIYMATGTCHLAMATGEPEFCLVVIEPDVPPTAFVMAAITALEKLAHLLRRVRAVFGMAASALMWRF